MFFKKIKLYSYLTVQFFLEWDGLLNLHGFNNELSLSLTHTLMDDEKIWDFVEDFVVVISLGGKCFEMSWGNGTGKYQNWKLWEKSTHGLCWRNWKG